MAPLNFPSGGGSVPRGPMGPTRLQLSKPVIAAVANAIYDATGARLRRAPFRAERVLAALKAANT